MTIKKEIIRLNIKIDLTICCLKKSHFKYKVINGLKVKGWGKKYTSQTLI